MAISYQRKLGDGTIVIDSGTSNVGIGTNDPVGKLHINDSGSATAVFIGNTGSGVSRAYFDASNGDFSGSDYMWIGQNNDLSGEIVMTQSAGAFHIKTQPSGTVTTRLTVLQNGNVGIGTTSPGENLTIVGDGNKAKLELLVTGNTGESQIHFGDDDDVNSGRIAYNHTSDYMSFYTNNVGDRMIINSSGNVGINNTNPSYRFHLIDNTNSAWSTKLQSDTVGTFISHDSGYGMALRSTSSSSSIYLMNLIYGGTDTDSGGTSAFFVRADGKVGIGTTSPSSKLSVNGSAHVVDSFTVYTTDPASGGTSNGYIQIQGEGNQSGNIRNTYWKIQNTIDSQWGNGALVFYKNYDGAGFSEQMRIASSGNVGIGTTTANTLLSIDGAADDGISIQGIGTTATRGFFGLDASGDGYFYLVNGGTFAKNIQLSSDVNVDNYIMGDLGVGTNSPDFTLDVEKDVDTWVSRIYNTGSDANAQTLLIRSDATSAHDALVLGVYADSGYKMVVRSTGNVGIGTTNPQTELHVKGINGWGEVRVEGQTFASGHGASLEFYSEGTALADIYASTDKHLYFRTNGTSERMRITSGGNVGIGTTSPGGKLTVSGSATGLFTNLLLSNTHDTNGDATGIGFSMLNDMTYVKGGIFYERTDSGGRGSIHIATTNTTDSTSVGLSDARLTVDKDGNVGIGETNPAYRLSIKTDGDTYSADLYQANSATDNYNAVRIRGAMTSAVGYYGIGGSTVGNTSFRDSFVVGTQTAHSFNLATSDTARMTITSGGNVGIGTTGPQSRLHVVGDATANTGEILAEFRNSNNDGRIDIRDEDGTNTRPPGIHSPTAGYGLGIFASASNAPVVFYAGGIGSERMRISGVDGNVGIGTASPSQKLHVEGAIYAGTANSTSGSLILVGKYSNGNIITIGGEYSNGGIVIGYGVKPSTTAAGAFLSSSSLTNLQRGAYSQVGSDHRWFAGAYQTVAEGSAVTMSRTMTLRGNGNLGLGTTNPQTKLHVQEGIGIFNVSDDWHQSSSGTHLFRGGQFNSSISEVSTSVKIFNGSGVTGKAVGNYWGGIAFMHLDPEYSTWGSSYAGEHFWIGGRLIDTPAQERSALVFATNNGTTAGTHSSEKMVILPNGNVGIGTTNPLYKLTVDSGTDDIGIVTASSDSGSYVGFLDNATSTIPKVGAVGNKLILDASQYVGVRRTDPSYALDVSGAIRATGDVIAYSDARVKENVETIPNALDKVKSMRGVGYNKIGEEKRSVGVIAQELLEVLPEAVHQDEAGMYSVAYGNIVGVLVEAMKEQQKQIDELKAQLDGITE